MAGDVGRQRFEADSVFGDEGSIEETAAARAEVHGVGSQQCLHHSLEHGRVATDPDEMIGRRERRRAQRRHLDWRLRILESLQAPLVQRIDDDDRCAAQGNLAQCAQHARMIRAGIVADAEDRIGKREIFSVTVPLPTPIACGSPTLVASWHMFEQSGKLLVP